MYCVLCKYNATIYLTQDVNVQILYFLFSLCMLCNHIFSTNMTVVSPIMSMLYEMYV